MRGWLKVAGAAMMHVPTCACVTAAALQGFAAVLAMGHEFCVPVYMYPGLPLSDHALQHAAGSRAEKPLGLHEAEQAMLGGLL